MSGSGFLKYEPIIVYIDLGDGVEPTLGFVDANRFGAWTLCLKPLGGESSVSKSSGAILNQSPVTVRAWGADGSKANTPLKVLGAEAPVADLESPYPRSARSTAVVPEADVSVRPISVYLDQDLTISGSGFMENKPVAVQLYERDGYEWLKIELGSVDSNQDGAWTLRLRPLGGETDVPRYSEQNLSRRVVHVRALGSDGTSVSTPLHIMGTETPAVELCPTPSLVAGTMWIGGTLEVLATGFSPNEWVILVAYFDLTDRMLGRQYLPIRGSPNRRPLAQARASDSGSVAFDLDLACQDPDEDGNFRCSLGPGAYTVEAFGKDGSYATAPLVVTSELGPK